MNVMYFDAVPLLAGTIDYPASRGAFAVGNLVSLARQSLPTDPVGTTTVTFSGVTVGSEIHVYLPDGTELTGTESCTANQALTWQVYAPGSPNNTVSITLIKRGIRPQKFGYLSSVGNKTIPLFPQPDLGYNNPA